MEDISIKSWTIRKSGYTINVYCEPERGTHHHLFKLQATLHCYNLFSEERVKRIYANTIKEVSKMALPSARALFEGRKEVGVCGLR